MFRRFSNRSVRVHRRASWLILLINYLSKCKWSVLRELAYNAMNYRRRRLLYDDRLGPRIHVVFRGNNNTCRGGRRRDDDVRPVETVFYWNYIMYNILQARVAVSLHKHR